MKEPGTESVQRLLEHELRATARTSEVEVASALARRHREGGFSQAEMLGAAAMLRRDMGALLVVEITATVVATSVELLGRHPLRAGDALQLAAALELSKQLRLPVLFVAFDQRLLVAAKAEKLKTAPE